MLGNISLVALVWIGLTGDESTLHPGERLDSVVRAQLEIETAGMYTLGRSDGALVLGERRSDTGWIVAELQPGVHVVELPDGPGDVTALHGDIARDSPAELLNRAIAQLNAQDLQAAHTTLLACLARPAPPAHHGLARLFLGVVLQREGTQLKEARALLLSSREAAEAFGPSIVALAENSLAQIALEFGEWDEASQGFERMREATSDPSFDAMAVSGLAMAAAGRDDHDLARTLHEEAVTALDTGGEQGIDPGTVFEISFQAGRWYEARAEFARAAELLTRAAAAAPNWYSQVSALGQLGLVELVRGHYGEALGLLDRAQAIADPHVPSSHDARLLQNRAALAYALGEFGVASRALERLLPLRTDDEDRAVVLSNQALLAMVQDDDAASERLYDEALAAAPEVGRARWLALNGKAAMQLERAQPKQAAPLAFQAMELADQLDDPYLRTVSLMVVGEAHLRLGAFDEARTMAEAAVAGLQAHDAHDLMLPALCVIATAALAQGDEATVEALIVRAWEESARTGITALSSLEIAQVRSRLSETSDWSAVAVDLAARRIARDPTLAAAELPRVARWKSRTLLGELANTTAGPKELAPILGDRTLVEYAVGDERLHAFVMQGNAVRLVDLGARRPIEALVQEFLDGLTDSHQLASPEEVARVGGELHERLLAPLELSSKRVVIVPSGELTRLPFEALVASAPAGTRRFDEMEFVIDRMDIGYAPSSTALVALAGRPRPPRDGRALLLGDPSYSTESAPLLLAARGTTARHWERLPQSRDEVSRFARLLLTSSDAEDARDGLFQLALVEDTRDVSLTTSAFELRMGSEASVDALTRLAPSAPLIHIASHARVDRWDARRSGLVLAWEPERQGLFNLADVSAMELDAELVVLSACQTADGRLLNGEGVHSVAGAFLAAGARGVVATLWVVQDVQARDLMETFGKAYLTAGEAPDRALRQAKRALRTAGPVRGKALVDKRHDYRLGHPHYWAAFLFSGVGEARGP